ncbi:MAG: tetratricopeptide repeat protein [Snowella sp.]|nr:tetratricopeptide repeat protein [Snowella sp.]
MQAVDSIQLSAANQDSFQDLLIAIEAGQGDLNLLLAICDNKKYREFLINNYEQFLEQMGIRSYRVQLNPEDPSLYQVLANLYHSERYLQNQEKSVVTVLGATDLLSLKLGEKRSQLEIFCGYLQYTREGLREFPFPVVLWLTNFIHDQIAEKANDFYSWRRGVFFFTPEPSFQENIDDNKVIYFIQDQELNFGNIEQQGIGILKIEDLQALLQALIDQKKGTADQNLATLYNSLGIAYQQKLDNGQSTDYKADLQAAISALQKAIELQSSLNLEIDLARSLNNLASLYKSQGKYLDAEYLLKKSLAIHEKQLGENHLHVATILNNLAELYDSQGKYLDAEPLLIKSLTIRHKQLGENHPASAQSLNNLASLYQSQGKYAEAEPLYLQSLAIAKKLGENYPDFSISLNNLAELYRSQGRYSEAEPLSLRSLTIVEKQLGKNHPAVATSLNNLALLYYDQGKYEEAEPLLVRSLAINEKQLGKNHPVFATGLNNLALVYYAQGKYPKAASLYQRAIAIATQIFGQDHPNTQTISNNYLKMLNEEGNQNKSKNQSLDS